MSKSRFDIRAQGHSIPPSLASTGPVASTSSSAPNPSFKAFQKELEDQARLTSKARQAAHHAHAAATVATTATNPNSTNQDISEGTARLTLDEVGDGDGRELEVRVANATRTGDRLLHPTSDSSLAIASLLAKFLHIHHGELILQLGRHNLQQKTLVSLIESPDEKVIHPITTDIHLPESKVDAILNTLRSIVAEIRAEVSILHNPFDKEGKLKAAEAQKGTETPSGVNDEKTTDRWRAKALRILVRRTPDGAQDLIECRVAVVGNVDAGKSSLLGVLTKGRLDDGRGRARVTLFRHKHEIESGRTSSVGMELLGFTPSGMEVVPEGQIALSERDLNSLSGKAGSNGGSVEAGATRRQQLSWEDISAKAAKIVSFADLAGHERYLKTTLFGLTATSPDFVLLIVGANAGLIGMSKEHLSVALALSVPVVCVVTKVDMTPPNVLEQTVKQLTKVLKSPGCRKQPVFVKDVGMACELAAGFVTEKACPIFLVSNVTGEGLNLLKMFLNVVPTGLDGRYPIDDELEFSISDVFSVPFVGCVVSGVILSGSVNVGDTVLLGPDSLGNFTSTAIKSIQRKRVNVLHGDAGQSVSFALKRVKRAAVRKGMVILQKTEGVNPTATRKFEGSVLVLYHNTLIAPRYQAMLHVGSVRQTVQIESIIDRPCIRTGDRATVLFKFLKQAEHLKVGDRFLFREGRTKALGIVTKLL